MATAPKANSKHLRAGDGRAGFGGGGKIRKTPYRNTQATPYDRPLTALRNSNNSVRNTNGWLSRLVDPASKIITSIARKILSSVFSYRNLPSSSPKRPASDVVLEDEHQGRSSMVRPVAEQNVEDDACGDRTFDFDEVAEIEQMLKEKKLTRHEIERLTTLLRLRTVSGSIRGEEENSYIKVSDEQLLKNQAQRDPIVPFYRHNGSTPTPTFRNRVFDEDITSPLELAKAYMSSRSSKHSPPTSDSTVLTLNSWTPYMKQSTSTKGSALRKIGYGEPSSSAYELPVSQPRVSGFQNASLKRRSSVLQDQYGSIGSIRRVRQKLNLLNSKGMDSPAHEGSPPVSRSKDKTIAIADTPTSSVDPPHFNGVSQQSALLNQSIYPQSNAISNEIPGSSAEKSPLPVTSTSETLVGKKIINLERGESSGVIKDSQLDNTKHHSRDSLADAGYSSMKDSMASKNKVAELNSLSKEKISDTKPLKNTLLNEKSGVGSLQKKHAFRMSVLEDFIDMDEDNTEGALSHNIAATPDEGRHAMTSSGGVPVVSVDVNEGSSAAIPSGSSRAGSVMGLKTYDEPKISEKSSSFGDPAGTSTLSNQSAMPNEVSKLSTETSLKREDDALLASDHSLNTPDRASLLQFNSSPYSGTKAHTPDLKLEDSRFGSGPAAGYKTTKQSEGEKFSVQQEAGHSFSKPEADLVADAPALQNSSIFSFGNAANMKESSSNRGSKSSLHSTALNSNIVGDTRQKELPATNSTILGSNNSQASASDFDGELNIVKQSTGGAEILRSTSAPMVGSYGTENNPAALFSSMTPAQLHTPETRTDMHFSSSSAASTSSLFSSMAPTVKSSDGASSSALGVASFAASSTSASSMNSTASNHFGASSTASNITGFTLGGTTIPGQTTEATNTGIAAGASTTPVTFGVSSTSGSTTSATPSTGFFFGGSTLTNVTSSSGISFGTSSAIANTTSTAGFSIGDSSTSAITSNGNKLPSETSSMPVSTSAVFSFGASSAPATTTSGFAFGGSTTPTSSNGFSSGASSTSAATSSLFSFGASSTSATTTSGFSVGASSSPTTASSVFPFGASSTSATSSSGFAFGIQPTAATNSGFSFGGTSTPATTSSGFSLGAWSSADPSTTSSPAVKTNNTGFSFGAPATTSTTAAGSTVLAAPTGATSSAFLFGGSSTSTPATPAAGFLSGISSTFGASPTPNPFSFGASSTPATSTVNNGSPFGFMAGSSTLPFTSGATNNTSVAQPIFGNTNPFGTTAAGNNITSASQPIFGSTNPFGSTASANNNSQTGMEDSMAEDSVQASAPVFPAFGAQQTANTSSFGFDAPNPSGVSNSFQFGSQPNLSNPSPFQSSGSLGGFSAGGSFSLGSTGGGDKSNRRIIKPKKGVRRK